MTEFNKYWGIDYEADEEEYWRNNNDYADEGADDDAYRTIASEGGEQ